MAGGPGHLRKMFRNQYFFVSLHPHHPPQGEKVSLLCFSCILWSWGVSGGSRSCGSHTAASLSTADVLLAVDTASAPSEVRADRSGCHGPDWAGGSGSEESSRPCPRSGACLHRPRHSVSPLADWFSPRERRDPCPQEAAAPPEVASVGVGRPGVRGEGRAPRPHRPSSHLGRGLRGGRASTS